MAQWLRGTPCSWDARSIPQLVLDHPTRQAPAVESELLDIEVGALAGGGSMVLSFFGAILQD